MRKQMKIAAVLSATALLAIGASFTAMAAEKGTWKLEDEGWVCYDKDGDVYEDTFCLDGGKEYYVGEDGVMLTDSWVDFDGHTYYVGSNGEKTTSSWKYLTPQDDEDADEEWYWFKANGKMAKAEKLVIEGKTYYFHEEGQMLTGWVDPIAYDEASTMDTANTVYCGDNGARLAKTWVETTVPGADEDEEDEFWYYIGSKGKVTTGKGKSINGATYLFDGEGKMLSGWVALTDNGYAEIVDDEAKAISEYDEVYFCGDADDGHVKKNQWIYEWANTAYEEEDADVSKKWFWITKDGTVYVPTATAANAQKKDFADAENYDLDDDGSKFAAEVKVIDEKHYAFNAKGEMQSGLIDIDGAVYYFGGSNDGARKTGSVTLEDDYGVEGKFLFSTASADKGVGIVGPKSGKLYNNGLLITSKDAKYAVVTVDGYNYIVNKVGSIQTTNKVYKDSDEIIIDAENVTFADGKGEAPKGSF